MWNLFGGADVASKENMFEKSERDSSRPIAVEYILGVKTKGDSTRMKPREVHSVCNDCEFGDRLRAKRKVAAING